MTPVIAHSFLLQSYLGFKGVYPYLNPLAYILTGIVRPIFFVIMLGFLGRLVVDPELAPLIIIGLSIQAAALGLLNGIAQPFYNEKWSGTLSNIFLSCGSRLLHYFSRGLAHYVNAFITIFTGVLAGVVILDVDLSQVNWSPFVVAILLIVTSLITYSLFFGNVAVLLRSGYGVVNFVHVSTGLQLTLTGIIIPISSLPWILKDVAHIMPITHGFLAVKAVFVGGGFGDIWWDLILELLVALGYASAGYVGFRIVEWHSKRTGILEAGAV